jgi:hypothetical protein
MNCKNCGTWNPDDKDVCWRCQEPLPKPPPPKPKRTQFLGLPTWMWVAFIAFFGLMAFGQCMMVGAPPA